MLTNPFFWQAVIALLGISGSVLAWFMNPAREKAKELKKKNADLAKSFSELDRLYTERDEALEKKDSNALTVFVYRRNVLRDKVKGLVL